MKIPPTLQAFFSRSWLPFLIGALIGIAIILLGARVGNEILKMILGDASLGLAIFGCYLFALGIVGLASLHIDISEAKEWVEKISFSKKLSLIAGVFLGIAMMAFCRNSGIYALGFVMFAAIVLGSSLFFHAMEKDILDGSKKVVVVLSVICVAIGSAMVWEAKCQICDSAHSPNTAGVAR